MYNHNCSFIQTLLMRRNIFTFSSVVFGQLYEIMPQKVKMYDAQNLTINFCLFFFYFFGQTHFLQKRFFFVNMIRTGTVTRRTYVGHVLYEYFSDEMILIIFD